MAESDERFLSRWARRKEETRHDDPAAEGRPKEAPVPAGTESVGPPESRSEADIAASLPDIDDLNEASDFSQFLQEGVPAALKRRALRRLWRLNPVFAHLDGLNDYDEDFTDAATVVGAVKTLYQVGKGIVQPEEEQAEAESESVSTVAEETETVAEELDPGQGPESRPGPSDSAESGKGSMAEGLEEREAATRRIATAPDAELAGETGPERRPSGTAASRRWGATN